MNISCILPSFLNDDNLSKCVSIELNEDAKIKVFIEGSEYVIPLSKEKKITLFFDWSRVKYFEDCTLLALIAVQNFLLTNGFKITHYRERLISRKKSHLGILPPFKCNNYVLRQLGAIGYLKYWINQNFPNSFDEANNISVINPLANIRPLEYNHEILPIISCESEQGLFRGSIEDRLIGRYEQDASVAEFIHQGERLMHERKIINNGEFGQLIIRQCRKNVIEHAKPYRLALSSARIVRGDNFYNDWNLTIENITDQIESPLFDLLNKNKNLPILDMTMIDDGVGITETIMGTWINNTLNLTEAYQRVERVTQGWPEGAKLIEFSLDKEGSRKQVEYRSIEDPGLNRISKITIKEGGILIVYSRSYGVLHGYPEGKIWVQKNRSLNLGTLIRVLIPLAQVKKKSSQKTMPKTNISVLAGGAHIDEIDPTKSCLIFSLYNNWIRTSDGKSGENKKEKQEYIGEDTHLSIIERINDLTSIFKPSLQALPFGKKIIIFDWSELPWGEHETSLFLDRLREIIIENDYKTPFIHINVPKDFILLAKKAVNKYSQQPYLPTCVFFEEGSKWHWIGLSIDTPDCKLSPPIPFQTTFNLYGDPESSDEQFLQRVFDSILKGESLGIIDHQGYGPEGYIIASDMLRRNSFFEEQESSFNYGNENYRLGRFYPVVPLKVIRGIINSTFISKLRTALESPYCSFPDIEHIKKTKGATKKLVQLPNGLLVDQYYRCDGLLHYTPKHKIIQDSEDYIESQINFRNELTDYLIDAARKIESNSVGRFDIVVSCTSPTHWFVHQIADGLSDQNHTCAHFVSKSHSTFKHEFINFEIQKSAKALIFTDVISTGTVVKAIIESLNHRGIKVGGLLALVDTRTAIEISNNDKKQNPFLLIQKENQIVFVHMPVDKLNTGNIGWKVDPETLEPYTSEDSETWDNALSGVGSLAIDGNHAKNWLISFGALKHKHYKHGSHHSATACDIKKIFRRSEARILIGGRLNLYVKTKEIDLVVYPNHSNAYMLIDMMYELGGGTKLPNIQIALCRYTYDERVYTLPENLKDIQFKNILILDDGFVTGKTIRSLITSVLNTYKKVKEIHFAVFLNEMSPPYTAYWSKVGGSLPMSIGTKKRKGAFLYPKIHFSSFMSLPHPSFTLDDCPFCRRQREFKRFSKDKNRTIYEREFYRAWSVELRYQDLYHKQSVSSGLERWSNVEKQEYEIQRSKDAFSIAKFEYMLHKKVLLRELVNEICTFDNLTNAKIHCIRALLHLKDTRMSYEQEEQIFNTICLYLENAKTPRRQIILLLKACIWEQVTPTNIDKFFMILKACLHRLNDPLIVGAVMAYARLAFPPGHSSPIWDREKLEIKIDEITKIEQDINALPEIRVIKDWLTGNVISGLGASVVCLKSALLPRKGHSNPKDDILVLTENLRKIKSERNLSADFIKTIPSISMRLIEKFTELDKAARVISSLPSINAPKNWESKLNAVEERFQYFRLLLEIDTITDWKKLSDTIYNVIAALNNLNAFWFSPLSGFARFLLKPFFNSVSSAIEEAISHGLRDFGGNYKEHDIQIDSSKIKEYSDSHLEVLCHPSVIAEALRNAVSNFWKYVVPVLTDKGKTPILKFDYKFVRNYLTIIISDNGIGVKDETELFSGDGGHTKIRPKIEEYDGTYNVKSIESGGTEVSITLNCRRIEN